MIGRRLSAHILNKLIIVVPALLLVGGIALLIYPNYFIFGKDNSWWMIFLYKYLMFLPSVFLDIIKQPSEILAIMEIIVPTLICFMVLDTLFMAILKGDLGMKILGLSLESIKEKPLSLIQIILRTAMKYFSLAFFPIAIFYTFFNKDKVTLHDKIAGTKVVFKERVYN